VDKDRFRIHIHNPFGENEIKFMYAPRQEGNAGTINGLYTIYSVLNRLFRKIISPRDGDSTNISHYAKNLLDNLRNGAPPFSVIDYIWEKIKGISLNPQKNCGFAPYLMFLIEDVTGRSFLKEMIHIPFRSNSAKKPLIPPAQASSPLRPDSTPQQQPEVAELVRPAGYTGQTGLGDQGQSSAQQREKSSSPIKKLFGLLFGMSRSHHAVETRLHEKRKAHKKLQKDMNEVKKHYIQPRLLPLWAPRKERATLQLLLSKDMSTIRTLIPHIHLLPTLTPLPWGLTLSLVVTLVSKVPHLMHLLLHLLQSSQDLAW
jgi:hypothetical protein